MCGALAHPAHAAAVEPDQLQQLVTQAQRTGAVPVVVHLADATLDELHRGGKALQARFAQQLQQLRAELGADVLDAGAWTNGVGQAELYVTQGGLARLQTTALAKSFWAGKGWAARTFLGGADGRFEAIEQALRRDGFADVEVLPNVDGLDFELTRDGRVLVAAAAQQAVVAQGKALLAALDSRHAADVARAQSQLGAMGAMGPGGESAFTLRLTREGVIKLATSDMVRSLRLVGHRDSRPTRIDPEIRTAAARDGSAEVLVTLRTPIFGGQLTQASLRAQARAHTAALHDVLKAASVDHRKWRDMARFGAMSGRLTVAQLAALEAQADARLLAIELVKPVATMALATSTVTMNLSPAWTHGYRAAGQNLVVMDNGTQSGHAFLRNATGQSRVAFEACFGSNVVINGTEYQSACPGADGLGDSPLGLAGSAAAVTGCWTGHELTCSHGTHVAGIAAGRGGAVAPTGVQGVGPDAGVIAVQVFSFDRWRLAQPQVMNADIVAAMDAAAGAMNQPAPNNPFTINLSLGGGRYMAPCDGALPAFSNAVQTLKALGVPVVAATGNDNYLDAVAWPACAPGVVQVSAVDNDSYADTRSIFGTVDGVTKGANLARPTQFSGEYMWLAPGGGGGTAVVSSIVSAPGKASYRGMQGTSQAAPHVAGIYAMFKAAAPGATVDGASEWIRANARVAVPIPMCQQPPCAPGDTVTFDRIRLPNL